MACPSPPQTPGKYPNAPVHYAQSRLRQSPNIWDNKYLTGELTINLFCTFNCVRFYGPAKQRRDKVGATCCMMQRCNQLGLKKKAAILKHSPSIKPICPIRAAGT